MKSDWPISAAGWISMPVTARETVAIARGAIGTPLSWSAWASRWLSRACTPGQVPRISSVPAPRAAGSRSRTARTSRRSSPGTRAAVPKPNIGPRLAGLGAAGAAVRAPAGTNLPHGAALAVDLEEPVGERLADPGEELQRLRGLEGADDPRHRAEHARDGARVGGVWRGRAREGAAEARRPARVHAHHQAAVAERGAHDRADALPHAGLVDGVAAGEGVGGVDDDVLADDECRCVVGTEARPVLLDDDLRVEEAQLGRRAPHLGHADVGRVVEDLAGQVRELDVVGVDEADPADAGGP